MNDEPLKMMGVPRSGKWPRVRRAHLKLHPRCAGCNGLEYVEVHHAVPVHVDQSLELDPKNLITLCEFPGLNCHFAVGHLSRWDWYWPNILRANMKMIRWHRREMRMWLEGRLKEYQR